MPQCVCKHRALPQSCTGRGIRISMQSTLFLPEVKRRTNQTSLLVAISEQMVNAFLNRGPGCCQENIVFRQSVMLSNPPENRCALVLLLSPRRARGLFYMISLEPTSIWFLHFLAPTVKSSSIVVVSATVECVGYISPIPGPDVAIIGI